MIKKLFKRLLPIQIILASIAAVNSLLSGIYGSNFIGADAMSAVGLFAPVSMLFLTVNTVLFGGTQVLCGKYMGKDHLERTNDIFSVDMAIVLITGGVFTFLMMAFATPLASLLGADEAAIVHLIPYIRGFGIGIIPLLATQQLAGFLSLEQQTRRTALGSIIYILINGVLGYLFVGRMGMGGFGLSLASSIGLWIYAVFLVQYYFTDRAIIRFSVKGIIPSDGIDIFRTGYAGALSFGYQVIRGFALNAIILKSIGNTGLAAHATYGALGGLFWAVPAGILSVGRLLMSVSYGEEDRDSLVSVVKLMFTKYMGYVLLMDVAIAALAVPITRLYYQDPAETVFQMSVTGFRIVPFCYLFSLVCVVFVSWGQISGKPGLVNMLSLIDGVAGSVLFAFLFTPAMGMDAIWWSYIFNGAVCMVAIVFYSWARRKSMPRSISDLLVIPEDFGVSENETFEVVLKSMDDVVNTSVQIQDFCGEKGIDEKRSYYAGLSMEEMAGNVLEHGFAMDKKPHTVDVRVVHKDDDVILRIKDDCVAFDPAQKRDIIDPEDAASNIGIRMVYSIAKEINYQHILGLNVLTIKI